MLTHSKYTGCLENIDFNFKKFYQKIEDLIIIFICGD